MITLAEVEKLGRVHAVEPVVLSVYLTVPRSAAELPGRVDELVAAGVRTAGRAGRLCEEDRRSAREEAALAGRGRPGQRLAVFACAEAGLLEAVMLPEAGPAAWPERAVLGVRPHIRPLLAALQPSPRLPAGSLAEPVGGLTAVGLPACLAAVNAGAVQTLAVPYEGLVPGYECGRCGALGLTADCCPDWGTAALPVPDLAEEMVSRTLEDGGQVRVVHDAPGGFVARMPSSPSVSEMPVAKVAASGTAASSATTLRFS
jgi:hypothetical protein